MTVFAEHGLASPLPLDFIRLLVPERTCGDKWYRIFGANSVRAL